MWWLQVAAQLFVAVVSGVGVFRLWRRFASSDVGVGVVALGFVARVGMATALFWISWLGLPIARSLQLGDGFWFYGLDGKGYHDFAGQLVSSGMPGLLIPDRSLPASTWIQLLSIGRLAMGSSAAVAGLINGTCFLGGAAIIAAWGRRFGAIREARLALVAISLSPSLILWATQPLKDSFFVFLLIGYFAAHWLWHRRLSTASRAQVWAAGLGLVLALYLVAGVRWYYGVILWSAFAVVSLWSTIASPGERGRRLARVTPVFLGMALALAMTTPWTVVQGLTALLGIPSWATGLLQASKSGFETGYDASTVVTAGALIDGLPQGDLIARLLMAFVPGVLLGAVSLVSVGGGRGLWAFADLDTLFFVTVVVLLGRSIWNRRPIRLLGRPAALFTCLVVAASFTMFYVVNNFGTLLRLRLMLLVPLALLPLTIVSSDRVVADEESIPKSPEGRSE